MTDYPHTSVLLNEWLEILREREIRYYLDGTLGAGGHAEAVLKAHPEIRTFYGVDQDLSALDIAKKRLEPWSEKLKTVHANFSQLPAFSEPLDAMLFDLGVSSMQLDQPDRGFSFMREGPLDMRMNTKAPLTAQEIVNTFSEEDIGVILRDFGEERFWRKIARCIVQKRSVKPIETTKELVDLLVPLFPKQWKGIHPLTRTFQALRIAVNGELDVLERLLVNAEKILAKGGVIGIITFHSLEDRIVKRFFRDEASDKVSTSGLAGLFLEKRPTLKLVTKKPLSPSEEEIALNPRARSAKLRVAEKL